MFCAKSTKYPKSRATSNPSVTAVTRRSTQRLLNDEGQSSESDFETDSDAVTATFRTESRITPRDYAIARPILNFISCICTDMKGPFKIPGLQGEIYYQSFIEKRPRLCTNIFLRKRVRR